MNELEELITEAKKSVISLERIVKRWKADADQYQKQVEEARSKNLPHDQMLSMMACLRSCSKEIEREWIHLAVAYNKPSVMAKVKKILSA